MYNHSGTWDFLKLLTAVVFVCVGVWWIESRFSPSIAMTILGGVSHLAAFAGGALLSYLIGKGTMKGVNDFAAKDAQVDRYRQQSFKAMASGDAAMRRAAAQLTVLDARRVDRLAQQQAKLLTDSERARWEMQQQQQRQPARSEVWDWAEDDDNGDAFQSWG